MRGAQSIEVAMTDERKRARDSLALLARKALVVEGKEKAASP
jgi:hypothetical protein